MLYSKKLIETIALARKEASLLETYYVGQVHVMLALLQTEGSTAKVIIEKLGIAIDQLRNDLLMAAYPHRDPELYLDPLMLPVTSAVKTAYTCAEQTAKANGQQQTGTGLLLESLLSKTDSSIAGILKAHGLTREAITPLLTSELISITRD